MKKKAAVPGSPDFDSPALSFEKPDFTRYFTGKQARDHIRSRSS